jgi:hypothetical protein
MPLDFTAGVLAGVSAQFEIADGSLANTSKAVNALQFAVVVQFRMFVGGTPCGRPNEGKHGARPGIFVENETEPLPSLHAGNVFHTLGSG